VNLVSLDKPSDRPPVHHASSRTPPFSARNREKSPSRTPTVIQKLKTARECSISALSYLGSVLASAVYPPDAPHRDTPSASLRNRGRGRNNDWNALCKLSEANDGAHYPPLRVWPVTIEWDRGSIDRLPVRYPRAKQVLSGSTTTVPAFFQIAFTNVTTHTGTQKSRAH
jgi:hypothetical protein